MIIQCDSTNNYPIVSISDCVLEHIEVEKDRILLRFDNNGIWIKYSENNEMSRVNKAIISLCGYDIGTVDIFELKKIKVLGKFYKIKKNIDFNVFVDKVNSSEWRLEFVHEYYSAVGGLFIGRLLKDKNLSDLYFSINYIHSECTIDTDLEN